jgi:hypothetical protein
MTDCSHLGFEGNMGKVFVYYKTGAQAFTCPSFQWGGCYDGVTIGDCAAGGLLEAQTTKLTCFGDCASSCANSTTCNTAVYYSGSPRTCKKYSTCGAKQAPYTGEYQIIKLTSRDTKTCPGSYSFDINLFRTEALKAHNYLRALHGITTPMTLADDLNTHAQKWADSLKATGGDLQHSTDRTNMGENIWGCFPDSTGRGCELYKLFGFGPVTAWYAEIKDWNFATSTSKDSSAVVGHFTQVVWKGSTSVGLGAAIASNGRAYVVANYSPAGNSGSAATNVPPLK